MKVLDYNFLFFMCALVFLESAGSFKEWKRTKLSVDPS